MKEKFIQRVKKKYTGKWIALKDKKLVAVSEDYRELYKKLKEKGLSGVYVFYSPTKKEKEYSYLF